MSKEIWLRCYASKGQFTDEVAIRGTDYTGEEFSFFVNQDFVESEGNPETGEVAACLRVLLLDQKDDLALIRLPGQTFGNGSIITVTIDNLQRMEREPA